MHLNLVLKQKNMHITSHQIRNGCTYFAQLMFICILLHSHIKLNEHANAATRPFPRLPYCKHIRNSLAARIALWIDIQFFSGFSFRRQVRIEINFCLFLRVHCRKHLLQWKSIGPETTKTSQRKETKEGKECKEECRGCTRCKRQRCQIEWKGQSERCCKRCRCCQNRIQTNSIPGEDIFLSYSFHAFPFFIPNLFCYYFSFSINRYTQPTQKNKTSALFCTTIECQLNYALWKP